MRRRRKPNRGFSSSELLQEDSHPTPAAGGGARPYNYEPEELQSAKRAPWNHPDLAFTDRWRTEAREGKDFPKFPRLCMLIYTAGTQQSTVPAVREPSRVRARDQQGLPQRQLEDEVEMRINLEGAGVGGPPNTYTYT